MGEWARGRRIDTGTRGRSLVIANHAVGVMKQSRKTETASVTRHLAVTAIPFGFWILDLGFRSETSNLKPQTLNLEPQTSNLEL